MLSLSLIPLKTWARVITNRFTVRIHTNLAGYRWAKLWYFLRGLDHQGSGFIQIHLSDLSDFLGAAQSTIYEWLRLGEQVGAFRRWRVSGGVLKCAIGSLVQVTLRLKLDSWGFTATIPLHEISKLKPLATGIVAQRLQQRSRYAGWRSLPASARNIYKLPQPADFFSEAGQLSGNSPRGSIPCLLHIGKRRIFVSKGFIPFGTNQQSIATERNRCDRTLRRHFNKIGFERKQLVQAKGAYSLVKQALDHVVDFESEKDGVRVRFPDSFGFGEAIMSERPGGIGKECHTHIKPGRIFRYADKDWMYRCNIYKPVFQLKTMRHRQHEFKVALEAQEKREKRQRDAEIVSKIEQQRNLAKIVPEATCTNSDPEVEIVNGQVITLFYAERTTTSSRREETTLCKSFENSFENFSETHFPAGEKDGQNS